MNEPKKAKLYGAIGYGMNDNGQKNGTIIDQIDQIKQHDIKMSSRSPEEKEISRLEMAANLVRGVKKYYNSFHDVGKQVSDKITKLIPTKVDDALANFAGEAARVRNDLYDQLFNYVLTNIDAKLQNKNKKGKKQGMNKPKNKTNKHPDKKKKTFPSNKGNNDLSWYNNYPSLAAGLIGANFARRKGITDNVSLYTKFSVPSVASLQTTLTIGKSQGDAYHTAINKLWASLRSANTGSVAYTKLDLEMYLLNLRMILAEVRYLRRAYGVIRKFDLFDKTTPVSIFKAMGLDYDTFSANAANLRNELNYISTKVHTLMPAKLDLLERTCWMFDHIFKDSNDIKAQLYLFSLDNENNYIYNWATSTLAPISTSSAITNFANSATATGQSYAVAMANLKSHIDQALSSNTVQIIAADILKAYGINQIAYFEDIPENYTVDYVYSEEVLTQIQNATIMGGSRSTTAVQDTSHNISVTNNTLVCEAHMALGNRAYDGSAINIEKCFINMYKNDISNLDLLGATRLAFTATLDTQVSGRYNLDTFGTEIITDFYIVTNFKPFGDTGTYAHELFGRSYSTLNAVSTLADVSISELGVIASLWATFDWAPRIHLSFISVYDNSGTLVNKGIASYPIWDFNNFALVDKEQLDTYNDIAILSEMYVDAMVRNLNLLAIK